MPGSSSTTSYDSTVPAATALGERNSATRAPMWRIGSSSCDHQSWGRASGSTRCTMVPFLLHATVAIGVGEPGPNGCRLRHELPAACVRHAPIPSATTRSARRSGTLPKIQAPGGAECVPMTCPIGKPRNSNTRPVSRRRVTVPMRRHRRDADRFRPQPASGQATR